ncbi:MAG: hypothetical protein RMK20_13155, partial [Verrucomicrobiales bacterium]|nr:hypothetical protein [Verrucomicrobiales bacterium]
MKTNPITGAALALALFSTLNPQLSTCHAQGTAFTYQGRLDAGGSPAAGIYDLRFALYDAASGGNQWGPALTNNATAVSNGLFTLTLDFGFGVFNGGPRWLEIAVRTNGGGLFTTLTPRQAVLPSPYAFWAANASQAVTVSGTVPASGLNGLYSNPVNFTNAANSFHGSFTGNGAGLSNVNAATLGGRTAAEFWQTGGNAGTSPGVNFLGTTDNQPLEVRVNNQRALRLEPTGSSSVNVIGGYAGNFVSNTVVGATIGGGGAGDYIGWAYTNRVLGDFGTVGGGWANTASGNGATVAGGWGNTAGGLYATVGGGFDNTA